MITLLNIDCMEYMATVPDKYFDLAIVDPPYGGGQHFNFRFGTDEAVYENIAPDNIYFEELRRISKDQIVWGGNYFTYALPVNRCWISWYKGQPIDAFSDFELAWTSFDATSKAVKIESYGFNHADKKRTKQPTIHPTQKPVQLYKWLLKNYAKPEFKIIDTHLGSGSSAIAAYDFGVAEFVGCEIDKEYFDAAKQRFEIHKRQTVIKF